MWGILPLVQNKCRETSKAGWWRTPLTPERRRQKQAELCELEDSLVYRASSGTARATQRNPVLKNEEREERGGRRRKKKRMEEGEEEEEERGRRSKEKKEEEEEEGKKDGEEEGRGEKRKNKKRR